MKQLFFVLMIALSLGACKKKETVTTTRDEGTVTTTTTTTNSTPTAVDKNLDSDVQDIMNAYNQYVVDYEKAVKEKNSAAMTELNTRLVKLQAKGQEVFNNAKVESAETADKLGAFMKEKGEQIQKISAETMH